MDYKHQIDMLYKLSGITAKTGHTQIAEFFTAVGRSIQKLLDENEQLRNEREMMKIQYNGEELTVQEICERLEKVENEKKMVINDLRVCSIENFMECQYCLYKTARSFCWDCTDGSNWKYRGERED